MVSNYDHMDDDSWWDETPDPTDPRDTMWREIRERERATGKARRGCLRSFIVMLLLLAVAFYLFLEWDAPKEGQIIYVPAETPKPESEETTMHYITPDWDELMVWAVLNGDEKTGADCVEIGGLRYTYDDLYLLAKIIQAEDGADGGGHEWPDMPIIALANVVLNRVASPLFPDTIREVLYQKGPGSTVQYAPVHTSTWEETKPEERYVRLAQRALMGERAIKEDVIYQALFVQGQIVMTYHDDYLGSTTYFCKG